VRFLDVWQGKELREFFDCARSWWDAGSAYGERRANYRQCCVLSRFADVSIAAEENIPSTLGNRQEFAVFLRAKTGLADGLALVAYCCEGFFQLTR